MDLPDPKPDERRWREVARGRIHGFGRDSSGAVTTDYVGLLAAAIGIGTAVLAHVISGTGDLSGRTVDTAVSHSERQTGAGSGGGGGAGSGGGSGGSGGGSGGGGFGGGGGGGGTSLPPFPGDTGAGGPPGGGQGGGCGGGSCSGLGDGTNPGQGSGNNNAAGTPGGDGTNNPGGGNQGGGNQGGGSQGGGNQGGGNAGGGNAGGGNAGGGNAGGGNAGGAGNAGGGNPGGGNAGGGNPGGGNAGGGNAGGGNPGGGQGNGSGQQGGSNDQLEADFIIPTVTITPGWNDTVDSGWIPPGDLPVPMPADFDMIGDGNPRAQNVNNGVSSSGRLQWGTIIYVDTPPCGSSRTVYMSLNGGQQVGSFTVVRPPWPGDWGPPPAGC